MFRIELVAHSQIEKAKPQARVMPGATGLVDGHLPDRRIFRRVT
ncbi:hypothetical protein ACFU8I_01960 [Streptomyces sp. NPDC057540]